MDYTNVVQIYQADIIFILQDKILQHTTPFVDDVPGKPIDTHYQDADGNYETIPDNLGICKFIWKHLQVAHWIIQSLENVNITISAKKFILTVPKVTILSHKCTFEGRVPHNKKVQKVHDWPECQNISQVHRFIGVCSVLCIFIQGFTSITHPLIDLTQKGVTFIWKEPQHLVMQCLKDTICHSPTLCWLNYMSGNKVILAVDTSYIVVRFISLQIGNDGKWYPNHFGSISLMEVESHYLQVKLELYRLFCALWAVHVSIFGVVNLTVKMDTKYMKGMINNPDLQPNVTINQWIAGILLFHFHLKHVPAICHTGPDGLSHQPPSKNNPVEEDDFKG